VLVGTIAPNLPVLLPFRINWNDFGGRTFGSRFPATSVSVIVRLVVVPEAAVGTANSTVDIRAFIAPGITWTEGDETIDTPSIESVKRLAEPAVTPMRAAL
jgi:hypothetical protein